MTSQAICLFQNSEYLKNETSDWEITKNTLSVYFDTMFDWDQG